MTLHAIAKDPSERYATAAALATAVQTALSSPDDVELVRPASRVHVHIDTSDAHALTMPSPVHVAPTSIRPASRSSSRPPAARDKSNLRLDHRVRVRRNCRDCARGVAVDQERSLRPQSCQLASAIERSREMRPTLLAILFACVACAAVPPAPSPAPVLSAPPPAATAAATAASPVPHASAARAPEPVALAPALPASSEPGVAAATCPDGEVPVPPTPGDGFTMAKGLKGEHRKVVLTHGFCMDQNEVSVREYARCVEAGACKEPWRGDPYSTYPSKLDEPVNLVSWPKAHAFCEWAGKRLPTEAEWEWAATGPEQYSLPMGQRAGAVVRDVRLHEVRRAQVGGRR